MNQIHLRHPIHGFKIAALPAEAEADKLHGWEEFDPNEAKAEPVKPKRGRPAKPANALAGGV